MDCRNYANKRERETILWDNDLLKKNTLGPENIPKTVIVMSNRLRRGNYENGLIISMTIG